MINQFRDEYSFLSNYYYSPVKIGDIVFPTVEHAFQAGKATSREDMLKIAKMATPGEAKRYGRHVALRPDWDTYRIQCMRDLLMQKFSQPWFKEKLIATYPEHLEEGNTWNDRFWGVCRGVGENHLGLLLMDVRKELMSR